MKCIEFLYFYLLPEQNGTQRAASSSSSSSSSSAESALFPPSPLSASTGSDTSSRVVTPSPAVRDPPHMLQSHYPDIDMSFVPMTPHKRPQPNLGYLTPSTTRRPSSSLSTTPSLPPVPASPRVPASPSTRRLASLVETSPEHIKVTETPRQSVPSREWRRSSMIEEKDAGLGFGLPSNQSGLKRSATAIRLSDDKPTFSDPFVTSSAARSGSGSSSGSSTVIQHRRSMSRSSIHISTKEATPGSQTHRSSQSLAQRSSKSHMSQSTMLPPPPPSRASGKEAEPRPKIRHSRTQSHLLALATASDADRPPVPPLPTSLAPPSTPSGLTRSPSSRPGRAFPAELTRGLPPSASSPALTPLGAAKRVPSGGRPSLSADKAKVPHEKVKPKGVKSVEEKKEMVSPSCEVIRFKLTKNSLGCGSGMWTSWSKAWKRSVSGGPSVELRGDGRSVVWRGVMQSVACSLLRRIRPRALSRSTRRSRQSSKDASGSGAIHVDAFCEFARMAKHNAAEPLADEVGPPGFSLDLQSPIARCPI